MMTEYLTLLLVWTAGILLGAVFFGGLWWTVRTGLTSKRPALWFSVSQLLRTSVTLTGFYLVAGGHWERLLSSLVGFITARHVVAWLTRSSAADQTHSSEKASHAT